MTWKHINLSFWYYIIQSLQSSKLVYCMCILNNLKTVNVYR